MPRFIFKGLLLFGEKVVANFGDGGHDVVELEGLHLGVVSAGLYGVLDAELFRQLFGRTCANYQ